MQDIVFGLDGVDSTLGEEVDIPLPKEDKLAKEEGAGESEAESTESDGLVVSSVSVRTPSATAVSPYYFLVLSN